MQALATSKSEEGLVFGCIEAEAQPALSAKYKVTVVPTFVFLHADGNMVECIKGIVEISQVTQAVQRLSSAIHLPVAPPAEAAVTSSVDPKEALKDSLSGLVPSSDVMLFMK
jgi:thioredoxin-like negative regulator of GroEL